MTESATAVAVLAAGQGLRFGGDVPKQLTPFAGRPLLAYALDAARASGLTPVLCVVSDDRVARAVPPEVEVVRNDAPERGIASSLHAVLAALTPRLDVDAVVIGLADQPLVGADAYRRVGDAPDQLVVATYHGTNGNPVKIARPLWAEALALAGDEGARALIRVHGAAKVVCDDTGDPSDIDTPEALAALERTWRSQTASE